MSEEPSYKFDTLQIHAGAKPDPATGARQTPIYQSTAFVFRDADHAAKLFNLEEVGYIKSLSKFSENLKVGQEIIKVSEKYFRPAEVDRLLGDSNLAREKLNWAPKISVDELCEEMINYDLDKEMIVKK